jgi:hypothetical protein
MNGLELAREAARNSIRAGRAMGRTKEYAIQHAMEFKDRKIREGWPADMSEESHQEVVQIIEEVYAE